MGDMQKVISSLDVTRLKQFRLWGLIAVILVFIVFMVVALRPVPRKPVKKVDHHLIEVKVPENALQKWTMDSEMTIKSLMQSRAHFSQQVHQLSDAVANLTAVVQRQEGLLASLKQQNITPKVKPRMTSHQRQLPKTQSSLPQVRKAPVFTQQMHTLKPKHTAEKQQASFGHANKNTAGDAERWLPMGSFFKADLLNGVEAGTGSHAQANPQPVLMRVVSDAFLPNAGRYPVKSCFILGSAYASLSSERVYIRLAKMACMGDKNRMITSKVKGYVVDSDGKIGLRGHLVNRQGAKLGKAMLAGFFSGLSGMGSHAQGTTVLSALGIKHHADSADTLRSAGFLGLGSATKELSSFYIHEAKRLFPVIEVGAGREVMVTVSEGVSLKWSHQI